MRLSNTRAPTRNKTKVAQASTRSMVPAGIFPEAKFRLINDVLHWNPVPPA
jgi:hypothetical protein